MHDIPNKDDVSKGGYHGLFCLKIDTKGSHRRPCRRPGQGPSRRPHLGRRHVKGPIRIPLARPVRAGSGSGNGAALSRRDLAGGGRQGGAFLLHVRTEILLHEDSQEVRDAAKGRNDTLSTAEIRAAMAKKSEEFKTGGRRDLSQHAQIGIRPGNRHPLRKCWHFISQPLVPIPFWTGITQAFSPQLIEENTK